jgi:hypothetical protein
LDTDNGGNNNIIDFSASENATHTVLEFIFEFDATDPLDLIPVANNTYPVFFAFHADSDDTETRHTAYTPILDIYFKTPTINRLTEISVNAPAEIFPDVSFLLTATLKDEFGNVVPEVEIALYQSTVVGDVYIASAVTNQNGDAVVNGTVTQILGKHSYKVKSVETVKNIDGNDYSFLSSEATFFMFSTGEPEPEEENYVILSRYAILVAFWGAGAIIWLTFAFNFYSILMIYLKRDKNLDPSIKQPQGDQAL